MDICCLQQYQYSGLRVNKNIYSRMGTLIIPAYTILTWKEIDMLRRLNIPLDEGDVEHGSILLLVESAIKEMKEVFKRIRFSDQFPHRDIRKKIIPLIMEMSQHADLKPIFNHLEQHDDYTYRHSIGVALLSRLIGKAKGLSSPEILELTTAGFLHDIGKAHIPEEILNKPGKLTREEFSLVKDHTKFGYDLLRKASGLSVRHALVALQHHEREDGSGYPYGLKGKDIDPYSKIVAVADVFHAMISKRSYKEPVPFYTVLKEISDDMYGSLEPSTTLCFLRRIMDMLIGSSVILSNGSEGKIIMVNSTDPVHPLVEVNGKYIDLSKEQTIQLDQIV